MFETLLLNDGHGVCHQGFDRFRRYLTTCRCHIRYGRNRCLFLAHHRIGCYCLSRCNRPGCQSLNWNRHRSFRPDCHIHLNPNRFHTAKNRRSFHRAVRSLMSRHNLTNHIRLGFHTAKNRRNCHHYIWSLKYLHFLVHM